MGWEEKGNLRGPAGYNAAGAAENAAALAAFTRETAGPNAFAYALREKVAERNQAMVPPLVAEAIGADRAVADAAAAAVGDALEGIGFLTRGEVGIPEVGPDSAYDSAYIDPATRRVVFGYRPQGVTALLDNNSLAAASDAYSSLELAKAYVFMHSWGRVRPDIEPVGFISRLSSRFRFETVKNNRVSGRTSADLANLILGPSPGSTPESSASLAWPTYFKRLPFLCATINDLTIFQGSSESTRAYGDAWRTMLTVISSLALRGANTNLFAYSPGFTKETIAQGTANSPQGATVNSTTGTRFTTTTTGAYVDHAFNGDGVDVIFVAGTTSRGKITATMNGSTVGTLDLTGPRSQEVPVPFKLRGLGAGAHTVRFTLTQAGRMTVDSARYPHPEPVPMIVLGEPPVIPGATDFAAYLDRLKALKAFLSTICAEFPTARFIDLDGPGWDTAAMLVPDGKHPNDRGHAYVATRIEHELIRTAYSNGLNTLNASTPTYTAPAAPVVPDGGHDGTI